MDPALVGRDRELAVARAFLDDLEVGARALVVEGDPGIGKTAVWAAVVQDALRRGYRVLTSTGDQAEARLSFVGLSDLLDGISDEALEALPRPQRGALEVTLVHRPRTHGRDPDAKAIGFAVRTLLGLLAQVAPVLLAIDDVQWLDGPTALALGFVGRRLVDRRVGFLVTARTPLSSLDPLGLERALGPDRRSSMRLGPLSLGAVRVLLETRLGHRYSRPVLVRIAEASGGNPLFALEIARALGPSPTLEPGAPLPVPDGLREFVLSRVTGAPSAAATAMLATAALTHPRPEVVERASSASGLSAAEESGLLRVEGERVLFPHPLYASAVYGAASRHRRRAMHTRLAELVEHPEEQARHLALAGSPPDEQVAARLDAAAADARTRGAWDAAGELLELARSFTPLDDDQRSNGRAVRAAEQYIHAGDRPRARLLLEGVLNATRAGAIRSKALRLLAEVHHNEDSFVEAARLLQEALEQTTEPVPRVELLVDLAFVDFNLGDLGAADRHAALALTEAELLGDHGLLAESLAISAMVGFIAGRGVDWQMIGRALELEDPTRVVPITTRPSAVDAALTLFVGRHAEAREKLNTLRASAAETGDESDLSAILWWLAWLELEAGNLDVAASLVEEGIVNAALTGSASTRAYLLGQRALVHAHRGDVDEARLEAADAATICASLGFWQPMVFVGSALGLLELSLGDPSAAWGAVRQLAELAETQPLHEPHVHQYLPSALEALIALGEHDRAGRLIDRFEERAREIDRTWAIAQAGRARGLLLAARGDLDGAEQALDAARDGFEQLEMPFELARTQLTRGMVQRRRRKKRLARTSLEEALALFEAQAAELWAARTRAELALLPSGPTDGVLTPAEQRVALLAAQGRSNKEIAGELFTSVHTVELHLSHAYAKLGIHSRRQLSGRLGEAAGAPKV